MLAPTYSLQRESFGSEQHRKEFFLLSLIRRTSLIFLMRLKRVLSVKTAASGIEMWWLFPCNSVSLMADEDVKPQSVPG